MKVNELAIQYPSIRATIYISPSSKEAELYEEPYAVSYGESRYQLKEGSSYEYEFESWEGNNDSFQFSEENEIVRYSQIARHKNRGTIRTGIYVGTLSLLIRSNSTRELVGTVELEVQSVKASYRSDYRTMLEDITSYYTDLVMLQGSPTTQNFTIDEHNSSQTLYQKFAFVRSIIDNENFQEAIHKIQSNPIRKWTEADREVDICNVKRLTRNSLRQIATRHNQIRVSDPSLANILNKNPLHSPLPFESLPRSIDVPYKRDTVDNAENQFVKYALQSFFSFCSLFQTLKKASDRLKKEAEQTCNKLSGMLSSSFFKEVSLPQHLNLNSPALQRKEGYREVLQAWLMFDLAAKLCWHGGDDVYKGSVRNVAMLYEYWIFFKLLEIVCSIFKVPKTEKEKLVQIDADGINLNLREGYRTVVKGLYDTGSRKINVRLYYNRTFGSTQTISHAGSWTTSMRPDYTLSLWPGEGIDEELAETENSIVHIHFDAKYRLNKILFADESTDNEIISDSLLQEKKEQEGGIYKRADLLKMHAYKDAIHRTSGAYIIYPGDINSTKKGYHEIIPGLGAFSISPGNVETEIGALKDFILQVVEHLLKRTSQREKMAYQDYIIHKDKPANTPAVEELPEAYGENRDFMPDETNVIVGYCAPENIGFLTADENHFYNMRTGDQKGAKSLDSKIITARYILLWSKGWQKLYKISKKGPQIYSEKRFVDKGYKTSQMVRLMNRGYTLDEAKQKACLDGFYLVFTYNKVGLERELQQYDWDMDKLTANNPHAMKPFITTLDKLMQFAIKK